MSAIACTVLAAALLTGGEPPATRDLRTVEIFDFDCSSDIGRRRTTLFANGTVRVRLWAEDEEQDMLLKELDPNEFSGYLNRLREVDLTESEESRSSPSGEWIQQCELELDLHYDAAADDERRRQPSRFQFGRYDSVSLALSRVVQIAEEVSLWAEEQAVVADFPTGYEPRPGDILERADGELFEVIAFTSDNRGIELWGVDQPLVVYVLRDELIGEFVKVIERSNAL